MPIKNHSKVESSLRKPPEAVFFVLSCWVRARTQIGTKFLVVFPHTTCLPLNELVRVTSMTKNAKLGLIVNVKTMVVGRTFVSRYQLKSRRKDSQLDGRDYNKNRSCKMAKTNQKYI